MILCCNCDTQVLLTKQCRVHVGGTIQISPLASLLASVCLGTTTLARLHDVGV